MKQALIAFFIAAATWTAACTSGASNQQRDDSTAAAAGDSSAVEKKAPNTSYKPAFAGQTRIRGIKTQTPYQSEVLTDKLHHPWAIANLPDGRFIVTEKEDGTLRIVSNTGAVSQPITGLPEVDPKSQGGLLDVAVDPDFTRNRVIYWTFAGKYGEGNLTALGKGKLSADEKKVENATVIYRATPAYNGDKHYGSRIAFDAVGNLYLSTGERSDLPTRAQAQQLNSALGKVLHLTPEGKPVAGNPFEGTAGARPEIWSYGHRNVQGLAVHPVTGDLWECEFGPRGGDELNRIQPGKNYGWATITYGIEYSGQTIGAGITQKDGMEQPVYYWDPVVSPSGMTFYTLGSIEEWNNNLFIACLSSTHIARLVIEDNRVTGEERLLAGEGERFRDVVQGKDGNLYAVTDNGKLYKVSKK